VAETRVLIVEDEAITAIDVERTLKKMGYRVCGRAGSGEEAIRLVREEKPDLILMDIHLRGSYDGVNTAEHIRTELDIPVVYVTASYEDAVLERAKQTGLYGYVVKPFREVELHMAIELALYKHQTDKKLKEYASELEMRNRELEAFAHTVAHDLKSILASIIAGAEVLEALCTNMPTEALKKRLHTLSQTGRKMDNLLEELLALSEARSSAVERRPLEMASVVTDALHRLADLIAEHHAEIIQPETWPKALGHGPWIEDVWANYISNAIKYGGHPPRVELGSTVLSDNRIRFWVRDNGPGISAEDQRRLFQPFSRLDDERSHGHGLGLSIVWRIIHRLGGEVGVESQKGQGSLFYFVLPAAGESDT